MVLHHDRESADVTDARQVLGEDEDGGDDPGYQKRGHDTSGLPVDQSPRRTVRE